MAYSICAAHISWPFPPSPAYWRRSLHRRDRGSAPSGDGSQHQCGVKALQSGTGSNSSRQSSIENGTFSPVSSNCVASVFLMWEDCARAIGQIWSTAACRGALGMLAPRREARATGLLLLVSLLSVGLLPGSRGRHDGSQLIRACRALCLATALGRGSRRPGGVKCVDGRLEVVGQEIAAILVHPLAAHLASPVAAYWPGCIAAWKCARPEAAVGMG